MESVEIRNDGENDKQSDEKTKKLEKDKRELLNKVLSGNLETKHEKVGFILNNYIEARNSDIELAWLFWKTFENNIFNGVNVNKEDLKKLTKINSLTRSRARIQNEYKLFEADYNVKKYRGVLADEIKEESIEEKPKGLQAYHVYIDETGKTQDYLCIGSLWIVDGVGAYHAKRQIEDWIKLRNIDFEFHFSEVKKHRIEIFKEFFLKYLKLNPTIGFKTIIIDNKGVKDINSAITDLTFHLIHKGIIHENETGRATLPRVLQVWLDGDEKGSDQLKIENLKERIKSQKIKGLYLGDFSALDSKDNIDIQVVDLFTGAINRKIHQPSSTGNVKDELADYIFDLLNFDITKIDLTNTETDKSIVFDLSYKG